MMIMKTITNTRLEIGKDILLEKGERLFTFKNKFNGEILYSTNKYQIQIRDGKEFTPVFKKPNNPRDRRVNLIASDALEKVIV